MTSPTGRDSPARPPGPQLVLVCVATFVVYVTTSSTPVALPAIRADLHASVSASQWLFDAYTLAFACLLLTAGSVGDRLGRGVVLRIGVSGFMLASSACALAPTAAALIAARAVQGLSAAVIVPLSVAVAAGLYADPRRRIRAIGAWGATAGVGFALGPLIGGLLVQTVGWRGLFWFNVPVGAVALVGLTVTLPPFATAPGRRLDLVGQALFLVGASSVTFFVIEGRQYGWRSPAMLGTLAVGLAGLAAFARWEMRATQPLIPLRLLRVPAVVVACSVNFLGMFGLYGTLFLLAVYLQDTEQLSAVATGVRFLALTSFLGLASVAASAVVRRFGTRMTMISGLGCVAAGLAGLTLVGTGVGYPGYSWALALLGVGVPLSSGVVAVQAMMSAVPSGVAGTASGLMNTSRQFGAVFGVALAGLLSPERDGVVHSMEATFVVASAGALLGLLVTVLALRRGAPPVAPAFEGPRPAGDASSAGDAVLRA